MTQRSCPSCRLEVAAHQNLCPSCRAPIPSDPGPLATSAEGSTIVVSAPPPRRPRALSAEAAESAASAVEQPSTAPDPTLVADDTTHHHLITRAPGPDERPGPDPAVSSLLSISPVGPAASAGTLGVPGAPALDDRGNLPGGVVAVLGALMVAVAVALPWIDVAGETVAGWSASADAKVLVGVAGLSLVAGALVVGGARSLVLRALLAVGGVATVGLVAFDLLSVSDIGDLDPSPGLGLYLGLAGGVVLLVGAALTRHRRFA